MSENELAGATALVTGVGRGFGQGIATALIRLRRPAGQRRGGLARCPGPVLTPDQGRQGGNRSGYR